jgi:uncharacterized membrane protein
LGNKIDLYFVNFYGYREFMEKLLERCGMETIGWLVQGLGLIVSIIAGLWFLVETFKSGVLWFIGCLLFGPVGLVWLVMHWEDGKAPFFLSLGGGGLMVLGTMMMR